VTAPNDTRVSWEESLSHIEAEATVWIRLATIPIEAGWQVRQLELTSGPRPPDWESRNAQYPKAWFVGTTASGADVVKWLADGQMAVGHQEVALYPSQGNNQITWDRRASGALGRFAPLPWPSTEAAFPAQFQNQQEPQGHVIAPTLPSFVTYYAAAINFFGLKSMAASGQLQQVVVYRHQDLSGRINRVRISEDGVDVDVEGSGLDGMEIELAGDQPGPVHRIWDGNRIETAHFELDDGLPSGAWLVLKDGEHWVDRRFLTYPFQHGIEAGVEYVVDPGTKLEAFLATPERHTLEFKEEVPTRDASKLRVMKTVAAFANGDGGSILFGINDERQFVGFPAEGIGRVIDQVTNMIGSWVTPVPPVDFDVLPFEGSEHRIVLELIVGANDELYGAGKPSETPTVYVRHYGVTERARPHEIVRIVQSRMGGQVPGWVNPFVREGL